MIRQFIRDTIADMANAVARSELVAENARLRKELNKAQAWVKDLREKYEYYGRKFREASEERDGLRAKLEAAERRGQVDRERAIEAVLAKLGFMSRDEACEAVDAVLGSAKEGPAEIWLTVWKDGSHRAFDDYRCAEEMSADSDWLLNISLTCIRKICEMRLPKQRSSQPAFTPAPTSEYASPDVLTRIRTLISASSSPTDAAPRIYALIAADHAAAVKRIGELEAENRRLVGELNQAKADRDSAARLSERDSAEVARLSAPCPADGMSDEAIGGTLLATSGGYGVVWERHKRVGAKARALFGRPAR